MDRKREQRPRRLEKGCRKRRRANNIVVIYPINSQQLVQEKAQP